MRVKKLNKASGNKPFYGEKMILNTFYVRPDQLAWLRARPNGISRTLRGLVDKAMLEDGLTIPEINT
jgi:hypothetical protein